MEKKYVLSSGVTVSAYTYVEAETEKEAIEEAEAREVVLGGIGAGADPYCEWVIEEADGEALNISIEGES